LSGVGKFNQILSFALDKEQIVSNSDRINEIVGSQNVQIVETYGNLIAGIRQNLDIVKLSKLINHVEQRASSLFKFQI